MTACGKKGIFTGNIVGNSSSYDIEFDWLDTTYTHDMYLEKGDSIEVSLEKEQGKVSAIIQMIDTEPVFQGEDMETSEFTVNINETGNYRLKVTGKEAKGHIRFAKQSVIQ